MKRGALIAAVVLATGAFACERKHDDKAGETTTTSGTVHEEQSTGSGYNYQGSPGVTGGGTTNTGNESTDVSGASGASGASTGVERNAQPSSGSSTSMGSGSDVSGSSLAADQSGSTGAKDAGIASDFDKKDGGGHAAPSTGTSKAKSGDTGNKSTPLGDGTSGQYTGGKGTYGGKATQGTGEKK